MLILCILGMKIYSRTLPVNAPWSIVPVITTEFYKYTNECFLYIQVRKTNYIFYVNR
jgi:hypothetical protein